MVFIDEIDGAKLLVDMIGSYPVPLYCDIETTGLDWSENKILLFQVMLGDEIFVMDVRKLGYDVLKKVVETIEVCSRRAVFHNAKFDLKFIYWRTGILLHNVYDTMTTEVVLNAGRGEKFYSLKALAEKYAGVYMDKESRSEFIDFPDDKPFTEAMLQYSATDVKVLKEIMESQEEEARRTFQTQVINLENSLLPVVAEMEVTGIRLDVPKWLEVEKLAIAKRDALGSKLREIIVDHLLSLDVPNGLEVCKKALIPVKTKRLTKFLEDITHLPDLRSWLLENFNVKSPLQMKSILHSMGIKVKDTNEKTLADFKGNEVIDLLLSIREVNKQIDAYGSGMLVHIKSATGKVHTEYFTVGTATGRFSSKNPNLQQVPTHGGYRECFIPDPEYVFISVDYSQQEYRLAGAVSRDPVIIKAYKEGSDMHTATGKIIAGKDEITKDERSRGKTVNFAILYGSTEYGLKRNLNISVEEAVNIINTFWDGYKNLSEFMKRAGEKILELGFSSTPFGRRRYNIAKPTYGDSEVFTKWQERVLREGKNHIIQGGGADILKLAMVRIHRENPFGKKLQILLQIHDELLVQAHDSVKVEAGLFVKRIMEEEEQRFLGEVPAQADGWNEFKDKWSK